MGKIVRPPPVPTGYVYGEPDAFDKYWPWFVLIFYGVIGIAFIAFVIYVTWWQLNV